jgi:formylglycine-generating enzyme required for sulfatase activity
MRRVSGGLAVVAIVGLWLGLAAPAWAERKTCPPDAVRVGPTCVDTYEASVWDVPPANTGLINKIKKGTATLADLTAGGATQVSPSSSCSPTFPGTFPATGNWTAPLYAVSIPGVHPTACVSWFQAEQACALSGKRLLTNQEWQRAAAGTPDPGNSDNGTTDCNVITAGGPVNTGSRSACVSSWGAFDMVGNVWEWVADWGSVAAGCTTWSAGFGSDDSCIGGDAANVATLPGALIRGGRWMDGSFAGVFSVAGTVVPSNTFASVGFRCAR